MTTAQDDRRIDDGRAPIDAVCTAIDEVRVPIHAAPRPIDDVVDAALDSLPLAPVPNGFAAATMARALAETRPGARRFSACVARSQQQRRWGPAGRLRARSFSWSLDRLRVRSRPGPSSGKRMRDRPPAPTRLSPQPIDIALMLLATGLSILAVYVGVLLSAADPLWWPRLALDLRSAWLALSPAWPVPGEVAATVAVAIAGGVTLIATALRPRSWMLERSR